MEDWTYDCGKNLRWTVARGEKPIEHRNSWFSTKSILVECCKIRYMVEHCFKDRTFLSLYF